MSGSGTLATEMPLPPESGRDGSAVRATEPQLEYDQNFTAAAISLFTGQREGHLGKYEYSSPKYEGDPVNGVDLWAHFLAANPQYYIPSAELILAERVQEILPRHVSEPVVMAFLGIGNGQMFRAKDLRATDKFNKVAAAYAYDINPEFTAEAHKELAKRWKPEQRVPVGAMTTDIFNGFNLPENGHRFGHHAVSKLATMFGLTVFNLGGSVHEGFPTAKFAERLHAIRKAVGKGGYFVTTHDGNQDPGKIESAYVNQAAFASNLAHRINRDTPFAVKVEETKFRVQYHKESGVLGHYLTLHHDRDFNARMTFDDGEYLINNSWKVTDEDFDAMATRKGFRVVEKLEENGVYLKLLQAEMG